MAKAHIVGSILGTAIGDSVGLPYEGLSRRRAERLLGPPDRHRFFFGRGMVSDDTEHTCMVAQSLIRSGGDPDAFGRSLAWGFRLWMLGLPAGIGFATLRSIHHDDLVDSSTQALLRFRQGGFIPLYSDEEEEELPIRRAEYY